MYHSQEDAEYKLINCHDWQGSLALTQLGLSTAGEFMWLPVVSNPNRTNTQWAGVITHTMQAPAMLDFAQHLKHHRDLETKYSVSREASFNGLVSPVP